ncbi:MAG: outer membrane lipoprotein-sorting protein [Desulfobacterales bacterium]|nr:outer membrane lipoprotein-sorting protein [Desulfobacterales bacterium]
MRPINLLLFLICLVLVCTCTAFGKDDPRARKIMERVDDRDDGDNEISEMKMILIDKHGKKRIREMRNFVKDKGDDILKLMFFLSPADVRDTGFLTYDYDDYQRDDDQWLYLPALRKSKRIASTDKSGSFMGTDFSYADMTKPEIENYDYTLLKESKVRDKPVWVIKAVPRTQDVIDEYGYIRSVLFVQKDIDMVVRAVHWLDEGNKVKYMDMEVIENIEGIWVGTRNKMTTKRGKLMLHKTIFIKEKVRFNQGLDETFFSIRQMEKGI